METSGRRLSALYANSFRIRRFVRPLTSYIMTSSSQSDRDVETVTPRVRFASFVRSPNGTPLVDLGVDFFVPAIRTMRRVDEDSDQRCRQTVNIADSERLGPFQMDTLRAVRAARVPRSYTNRAKFNPVERVGVVSTTCPPRYGDSVCNNSACRLSPIVSATCLHS